MSTEHSHKEKKNKCLKLYMGWEDCGRKNETGKSKTQQSRRLCVRVARQQQQQQQQQEDKQKLILVEK